MITIHQKNQRAVRLRKVDIPLARVAWQRTWYIFLTESCNFNLVLGIFLGSGLDGGFGENERSRCFNTLWFKKSPNTKFLKVGSYLSVAKKKAKCAPLERIFWMVWVSRSCQDCTEQGRRQLLGFFIMKYLFILVQIQCVPFPYTPTENSVSGNNRIKMRKLKCKARMPLFQFLLGEL